MLPHPTHDRLIALGLVGMAKAFEEQRQQPAVASLTFEERHWIGRRQDLLITGKTGTGKSWLACALGNKACRDDRAA
jgi:DNA replication protein DnaC